MKMDNSLHDEACDGTNTISGCTHQRTMVHTVVRRQDGGLAHRTKTFVDNGNTVHQGIAISEDLHNHLGAGFSSRRKLSINTASKGGKLHVLGVSAPIDIKFQGMKTKYSCMPLVIKDLADDINVGTGFLQRNNFELKFSPMGTVLVNGEKESTQLINAVKEAVRTGRAPKRVEANGFRKRECSVGNAQEPGKSIISQEDTILKPNMLTFIKVPGLDKVGNILVTPMTNTVCNIQAVSAVYNDPTKLGILNLSDEKIKLKKGAVVAQYHVTKIASIVPDQIAGIGREGDEEADDAVFKELVEKLKFNENDLLNRNPQIKGKLLELVREYTDVFAEPESVIGTTDVIEFDIKLKEGSVPHRSKLRPLNPDQQDSLRKQLDDWLEHGVIEPSESPWAAALVPAFKKGGGIRWAVDYRRLNEMSVMDSYPLPNISENLDKLSGSKVFTALDAASAYHTIKVTEKTRPYLAFNSPFGLYEFARMPFGPKSAPAVYSRFIELCLSKIRSPWILAYLDDIIIHTHTLEEHLEEVRKTLEMHRDAGIKLRASKCEFFKEEINYLGYHITAEGIKMREDYINKIIKWPKPQTVKQLQTYLGFLNYYRSFIIGFSKLTKEMNAQRSSKRLHWTKQMDENFFKLRDAFRRSPIRAYPDYKSSEPFKLTLDFSQDNLAAILSQNQRGKERLIAASGRGCTPYEKNYGSTKGELAALIFGLRKYEHILRFKPFEVYTDASALKHLTTIKNPRGIWFRWINEVLSYDMKVFHRPGRLNTNADSLSRCNHLDPPTEEDVREQEEFIECLMSITNGRVTISSLGENDEHEHETLDGELIKKSQVEDPILRKIRDWVQQGHQPSKEELKGQDEETQAYAQILGSIFDDEGTLVYRYQSNRDGYQQEMRRILIPENLRQLVYHFVHCHPSAGHFGKQATVLRAIPRFYWPGMNDYLKLAVKNCADCLAKIKRVNLRNAVHYPQKSGFPGERIALDLVGPLPETVENYKYILTIQDHFTRFVMAIPIVNKEAETVANVLIERFICLFGCPNSIHSDRGTEFHNKLWTELLDRLEIKKTVTPPYNPQSNWVERFHRTLNAILSTFLRRDDPNWFRYLGMACLAYNTKVNVTTGCTPYQAWFGRRCKMPLDLIIPTPQRRYETVNDSIRDTMDRFSKMFHYMRQNQDATWERNARLYTGNMGNFKDGDIVWYFATRKVKGKPQKLTDMWIGPYKVIGRQAPVLIKIKPADFEGDERLVHCSRLRPYFGPKDARKHRVPVRLDLEDEGDEMAEEIHVNEDNERWITEDLRQPPTVPIRMEEPIDIIVDRIPTKKQVRMDEPSDEITEDGPTQNSAKQQKKNVHFVETPSDQIDDEFNDEQATSSQHDTQAKRTAKRVLTSDEESEDERRQPQKRRELDVEKSKREAEDKTVDPTVQEQPKRIRVSTDQPAFLGKKLMDKAAQRLRTSYRDARDILSPGETTTTTDESDIDKIQQMMSHGEVSSPARDSSVPIHYDVRATHNVTLRTGCITPVGLQLRPTEQLNLVVLGSRPGLADKGITTLPTVIDLRVDGSRQAYLMNGTNTDLLIHKGQRISLAYPLSTT